MGGVPRDRIQPLVLVADDDATVRLSARAALEAGGFQVTEAPDGAAAVAAVERERPDLVVLDLMMPVLDGFEACRRMRALREGRALPILVLTGLEDAASIERAYEAGATDFLTKPISWNMLAHHLRYMARAALTASALLRSERRHRSLLEALPDLVLLIDRAGTVRELKDADPPFAALRPGSPAGRPLQAVLPRGLAEIILASAEASRARGGRLAFEWPLREGGTETWHDIAMAAAGPDEAIVAVRDVTERKRLFQEIVKSEKLTTLGTFAGGVAHDFGNLLTALLGNLQLVQTSGALAPPDRERIAHAERAALQARDLTRQLLLFTKGDAPRRVSVSLPELVREAAGLTFRGSAARCEQRFPEDLWPVLADPAQLGQALHNLLLNALQAMPGGGICLVEAQNEQLREPNDLGLPAGRYLRIAVRDEGTGIAPEHLGRLCEPHFSTKSSGSGLGLSIVDSVVRRHGGALCIASAPGEGATFTMLLPAADAAPPPKAEDPGCRGQGRVLFMDDDPLIREVAGAMLANAGYRAECVPDGEAAVELYRRERERGAPFDALILDQTVPGGMGGREALRRVLALDPEARAVLAAGDLGERDMARLVESGFREVLPKPFGYAELCRTLGRLLGGAAESETDTRPREG